MSFNLFLRYASADLPSDIIKIVCLLKFKCGKGRPARFCAHKDLHIRRQTILMISEGKSAEAYLKNRLKLMPKGMGYNFYGTLPIQGKLINTSKCTVEEMLENKEVLNIMKSLNLELGVDYSIDENFDKLSYGKLMVVVDADDDGGHIQCLLLVFFCTNFPTLAAREYFCVLRTPIVKAVRNKKI